MELRDYVRILRKSWVLIVVLTLASVAAAAAFSLLQQPSYSATSKVFVSTQSSGTTSELAQGNNFSVQRVKTYVDLMATPLVLSPVIDSLGLETTVDRLVLKISASAPLDTSIIAITALDADPERAAAIANAASKSLTAVVGDIETPGGADAVSPVKLTLAQEAVAPTLPDSPNVPLNLALGALVGLALGLGAAVLREAFDTRIRNQRDVERITKVAVLGGIVFDPKAQERPLIVHVDPRSPRAESFRSLRTNLQYVDVERVDRSFVVTSSIEAEGKSTTGANLAIALAATGSRVLLVDADLRRPKLGEYLGIEGGVGLTDLLVGRAEFEDIVQPWGTGSLFVLPAGHVPPNPSELLGSARMSHFIEQFNRDFDVVIYDTPPLLPVTDAAVLAKNVGGAIIVVAAGRTNRNQLKGAITSLDNVGAAISGIVLTMLPSKGPDAYGYGHYGYAYAEGAAAVPTGATAPGAAPVPTTATGAAS